MTKHPLIAVVAVLLVLALAACGNGTVEEPEPTATNIPVAPTVAPTPTPVPTATAVPSPTPSPTPVPATATATSEPEVALPENETVAELCDYINEINDSENFVGSVEAFIEFATDSRTLALLPSDTEEKANLLVDVAEAYVKAFHSGTFGEQAAKAVEPALRAALVETAAFCATSGY